MYGSNSQLQDIWHRLLVQDDNLSLHIKLHTFTTTFTKRRPEYSHQKTQGWPAKYNEDILCYVNCISIKLLLNEENESYEKFTLKHILTKLIFQKCINSKHAYVRMGWDTVKEEMLSTKGE